MDKDLLSIDPEYLEFKYKKLCAPELNWMISHYVGLFKRFFLGRIDYPCVVELILFSDPIKFKV